MWIGPLPEVVCLMINMGKCYGPLTFVTIITILTIMKFLFLCVLKTVPEFDDDFMSKTIIGIVMTFGTIVTMVKYGFWSNPSMNEVMQSFLLTFKKSEWLLPFGRPLGK